MKYVRYKDWHYRDRRPHDIIGQARLEDYIRMSLVGDSDDNYLENRVNQLANFVAALTNILIESNILTAQKLQDMLPSSAKKIIGFADEYDYDLDRENQ